MPKKLPQNHKGFKSYLLILESEIIDENNSNNYKNPHNYRGHWVEQEYLPKGIKGFKFWEPSHYGWEKSKFEELRKRKES